MKQCPQSCYRDKGRADPRDQAEDDEDEENDTQLIND